MRAAEGVALSCVSLARSQMPRAAFSGDTLKCHYLAETARRRAGCFGGARVVVDESTTRGEEKVRESFSLPTAC